MLDSTLKAVESVCLIDPSVDRARLRDALRVLAGELGVSGVADANDKVVSRREAAQLLGVCPQTISLYCRRGVVRPVRLGETGARASGYSLKSIREALAR